MREGRVLAWMLAIATLLSPGRALSGAPIELVYLLSGKAEACPDKATLEKAVRKRLGYHPFFAAADRKLVAEISSKGNMLHARVTLVDQAGVVRGNRQLTARVGDCDELIASLALAISITLDPMSNGTSDVTGGIASTSISGADRAEPATAGSGPKAAAFAEANGSPTAAASSPVERPPANIDARATQPGAPTVATDMSASLGVAALMDVLPKASPGIRVGVEAARGPAGLGIELTGTPIISYPNAAGQHADMSLLFASVVPCGWLGPVGGCAVVSLGRLHSEGRNVESPKEESHLYAAAGLRVIGLVPLTGPLKLRLYVGSAATFTRPSFELAGVEIWRPAILSLEAAAAFSLQFL